jgi:hypothetical protein
LARHDLAVDEVVDVGDSGAKTRGHEGKFLVCAD